MTRNYTSKKSAYLWVPVQSGIFLKITGGRLSRLSLNVTFTDFTWFGLFAYIRHFFSQFSVILFLRGSNNLYISMFEWIKVCSSVFVPEFILWRLRFIFVFSKNNLHWKNDSMSGRFLYFGISSVYRVMNFMANVIFLGYAILYEAQTGDQGLSFDDLQMVGIFWIAAF